MSPLLRQLCGLLLILVLGTTGKPAAPPAHLDRHGDPMPRGAVARMGSLRYRIGYGQMPVALSPDGKQVFLAGQDGSLSVYDLATGAGRRLALADLKEENPGLVPLLSPTCDRALIQSDKLTAYDVPAGKKLWALENVTLAQACFEPTGKHFARLEADANKPGEGKAIVHRADNGKQTGSVQVKGMDVRLALSPGATWLLSYDTQPNAMMRPMWELAFHDVAKAKEIGRVFFREVPLAAFRPDGKEVAIAAGNTITFLDPSDPTKTLRTLRAGTHVSAAQYSPDGKYFAAVGFRRADLWEVKTWKRLPTRPLPDTDLSLIAFPAPGQLLLASALGRELNVTDARSGKTTRSPGGHGGAVTALCFDGSELRTAGGDGKVTTWDASGRQRRQVTVVNSMLLERGGINLGILGGGIAPGGGAFPPNFGDLIGGNGPKMSFSHSGRWVFSDYGSVYDLKADETRFDDLAEGAGNSDAVCIHDDVIFVGGLDDGPNNTDCKLSAVRLDNGEVLWSVKIPSQGGPGRVAVSPDGKTVAMAVHSGEMQSSVHLFDATTGKALERAKEYEAAGFAGPLLEFSADGRFLVGSTQESLFFLDPRTGALLHSVKLEGGMGCAALCPLGRSVAVSLGEEGSSLQAIHVFEISSGKSRLKLTPGDVVTALRFSPDGKRLASGHDDGTALVWELEPERTPMKGDAWERLSGEDAADAYRAMWQLRRDPERAVALVTKHVKPSPLGPEAAELKRLIAGLDDDDVKVRDESEDALHKHGRGVEAALRQTLERTSSTEVKRRVRRLLAALPNEFTGLTPALRGVELLEGVGTKAAIEALQALAKGNESSRLTREAKAALLRLTKASKRDN